MNFQFYLEKLYDSEEFQKFKQENPSVHIASGFVVIDLENKGAGDKVHIDYYIPEHKKMMSFQLSQNIEGVPIEQVPDVVNKIADNIDFEFKEIEEIIKRKMEEKNIKKDVQKILLSLQNIEGKDYLIGTVFTSGLGMIKVNILLEDKSITEFQNKSFLDMINIFKKEKV